MLHQNDLKEKLDSLLQFVSSQVQAHHEKSGRGLPGSDLAAAIRHKYPTLDYTEFGLTKLGDLVRVGEERGLWRRNDAVRHLEVLPATAVVRPSSDVQENDKARFLRPPLWRAFVLGNPSARAFYHRQSGTVRELELESPELATALLDPNLVEIERIRLNTQLGWLRNLLVSRNLSEGVDEERLRSLMRGEIYKLGSSLGHDWKVLRSGLVVEHAKHWARRNNIEESEILVAAVRQPVRPQPAATSPTPQEVSGPSTRAAILAALGDMPLEELQRLPVPVHYLLKHFVAK